MLYFFILLTSFFFIFSQASIDYHRYISFHWKGGLTSNSIIIKALPTPLLIHDDLNILLIYYQKPLAALPSDQIIPVTLNSHPFPVVTIKLDGLSDKTRYYYSFVFYQSQEPSATELLALYNDGQLTEFSFKTLSIALTPGSFSFGAASCANTGSDRKVFDYLAESGIDFFIHMGDLHYEDISFNDEIYFYGAYAESFASPRQNKFFQTVPIVYIWDDHDYGINNADGGSESKQAATVAYKRYTPYHELKNQFPADDSVTFPGSPTADITDSSYTTNYNVHQTYGIYRSFIVGRVLFVILDLRTWKDLVYREILGEEQLTWFENQLKFASLNSEIAMVVVVSTIEWINSNELNWGYYKEHQTIAGWIDEYINKNNKELVFIGGDSHMIAFDDGRNAAGGSYVIQAASMDRRGSCKGGPYSHGVEMGGGHYGIMTVTDDGTKVCLKVSLRDEGEEIIGYDTCNKDLYPGYSDSYSCFKAYVNYYLWLIVLGAIFVFCCLVGIAYHVWKCTKPRDRRPTEETQNENVSAGTPIEEKIGH